MSRVRWMTLFLVVLACAACSRKPTTYEGRLYYTVEQGNRCRIEWVDPEGTRVEVLPGQTEEVRSPAVSPDGRSLALLKGTPLRVHVLDLVQGGDQQVSETRDTASRAAWAPVGRQLAYLCHTPEGRTRLVLHPLGGEPRVVREALNLGLPTWSPVGSRILYSEVDAAGVPRLYSQALEGGQRELVLQGASQPAMATLGTQVAVVLDDKLQLHDLYSRERRILVDQPGIESPSWSPTGKKLAFVREGQVWTVGVDGSGLRQVTRSESPILDVCWGKGL